MSNVYIVCMAIGTMLLTKFAAGYLGFFIGASVSLLAFLTAMAIQMASPERCFLHIPTSCLIGSGLH